MPLATLLLRETTSSSLTSIVEKSQRRKPPLPTYDLVVTSSRLDLILNSKPDAFIKPTPTDEGFESDIDSISIISSDDATIPCSKPTAETDSANGSSDSDTETCVPSEVLRDSNESYHLVDCVCYTDVKFPNLLVFVIKGEALVFRFEDLGHLQSFYANFSALKAVTNQKAYRNLLGTKFNLLHRTDNNGVTHIQITREPEARLYVQNREPSRIISIKTPDAVDSSTKKKDVNSRQRNESRLLRSNSSENILDTNLVQRPELLRKVWTSAEDLLNPPKPPERRKKSKKGRAPAPPPQSKPLQKELKLPVFAHNFTIVANKPSFTNILNTSSGSLKPKLTTYQQFKHSEPKKLETSSTLTRSKRVCPETSWTNSVPRLLRKPRSRSETRNFTPMAYRYIDTTAQQHAERNAISNRLFGMSSKLREFNEGVKWGSLGDLSYKVRNDGSLKSVIKKEENKRKGCDKKVTFSAYTTVQVV